MSFIETESAISEVMASLPMGMGGHIEQRIVSGAHGMAVGEVPFDPTRHNPGDIKPFSIMSEVLGEPFVDQVLPMRPLEVQIVSDYGNTSDIGDIAVSKMLAIHSVSDGLETTMGIGDKLFEYAVGLSETPDFLASVDRPSQYSAPLRPNEVILEGREVDAEYRAQTVGMLCLNGLTIVLSDFHSLPLDQIDTDFSKTLAVKINHPFERRIPANVGVIGVGSDIEVNTNSSRQLKKTNEMLEARHREVVSKLQNSGIHVVSLVTKPSDPSGIDLRIADNAIANGLKALTLN